MMIAGRIGHESTLLKDGRYIRDLSYMNRDIKNIVCIDFDPEKFYLHQDNVIKIPQWDGDMDDRTLIDLIPFLEHLANPQNDVRKELDKYGHENPAPKFNEIQSARLNLINQKRDSGFGGMLKKFNQSQVKAPQKDFDESKVFPSQFKSE